MQLCTSKDIYFEWLAYLKREAHWSASLTSGDTIYEDDYREECPHNTLPIPSISKAWDRLRIHVSKENVWIKNLWLQNLDNVVKPLPDDADGYFFKKGAIGQLFADYSRHFYIIGYLDIRKKIIKTFKYGVPELLLLETEDRKVDMSDPCLIVRPGLENMKL